MKGKLWMCLAAQYAGSVIILVLPVPNWAKAPLFAAWWAATFRRPSKPDALSILATGAFFTVMDISAVGRGVFTFDHPDFLGITFYEPMMWAYFTYCTHRMVSGSAPENIPRREWGKSLALTVLFSVCFFVFPDPSALACATAVVIALMFFFFHEKEDFSYLGIMVLMGLIWEQAGVKTRQWHYPGHPWQGVPLWFACLWGGVGLLSRRLIYSRSAASFQARSASK